jgi:hypothetical protein
MLAAILRGKLSPEQENMEDILTSNVFGALKYVAPEEALLPFLAEAQQAETKGKSLAWLKDVNGVNADYCFWPWWEESGCVGCEPDVVLRIDSPNGKKSLVLVEAKLFSGKSSEGSEEELHPTDQLAREWHNLVHVARREDREPVLIYLTAGFCCPLDAVDASRKNFEAKTLTKEQPFECLWLSWRHLEKVIRNDDHPILKDLWAVLQRLALTFFNGVSSVTNPGPIKWSFQGRLERLEQFDWTVSGVPATFDWRFKR